MLEQFKENDRFPNLTRFATLVIVTLFPVAIAAIIFVVGGTVIVSTISVMRGGNFELDPVPCKYLIRLFAREGKITNLIM
jgi:hypothetical protein